MKKFKKIIILIVLLIQVFSVYSFADSGNNLEENSNNNLDLDCGAAILIEDNTGIIVYEKNSHEKLYPASTTKVLTAIIVLEKCNLDDLVTVSASAVNAVPPDYTKAHLQAR